jgi:ABC-type transport system involved in cytochrome c biogenesis permease subunit
LYSFALLAFLLAFHLAPIAHAAPRAKAAAHDDAVAVIVGGAVLVFLGGAFLGFLGACAYLWRLVTVAEAAATDRFAHVLAWLFGTTDDIQALVAEIITTGGARIQTLRDELAQLRKEMRRG